MPSEAFRFTTGELATFIPVGTILGAIVGGIATYFAARTAYQAQQHTVKQTIEAQAETTRKTIEAQQDTLKISIEADRDREHADRLWNARATLFQQAIQSVRAIYDHITPFLDTTDTNVYQNEELTAPIIKASRQVTEHSPAMDLFLTRDHVDMWHVLDNRAKAFCEGHLQGRLPWPDIHEDARQIHNFADIVIGSLRDELIHPERNTYDADRLSRITSKR